MSKIHLAYSKIPNSEKCLLNNCIAFEKYDGTNIHVVWNKKWGWIDFGTRRDRFPLNNVGINEFFKCHPELGDDKTLKLIENISDKILDFVCENTNYNIYNEVIIFMEYHGPNSFAGQHDPKDIKKLTLIDVMTDGQIIPPQQFLDDFKDFDIAKVIYKGKYSGQFSEDVRNGKYSVNEGVVCKGVVDDKVYMCKIKTNAYMNKLQTQFKDNWKDYWE